MARLDQRTRLDPSRSIDAGLRELDLPPDEVDAVVAADHPVIVHRYLELHRERLQERLAEQLRTLEGLERLLAQAILEASPPRGRPLLRRRPRVGAWPGRSIRRRRDDAETSGQPRGLT